MHRLPIIIAIVIGIYAQQAQASPEAPVGDGIITAERMDIVEHNGNCQNKHRLRHNGQYRKHCKEQHGIELPKKK